MDVICRRYRTSQLVIYQHPQCSTTFEGSVTTVKDPNNLARYELAALLVIVLSYFWPVLHRECHGPTSVPRVGGSTLCNAHFLIYLPSLDPSTSSK